MAFCSSLIQLLTASSLRSRSTTPMVWSASRPAISSLAEQAADAAGEGGKQFVRLAHADAVDDAVPVVRHHHQHALALGALGRAGHGLVDELQRAGAVVQAGHRHRAATARPARHRTCWRRNTICRQGSPSNVAWANSTVAWNVLPSERRACSSMWRGAFSLRACARSMPLKFFGVVAADQVQYRQAQHVVEFLVAEGFEIGLVGAYVHAFVNEGDRVGGGVEQRVARRSDSRNAVSSRRTWRRVCNASCSRCSTVSNCFGWLRTAMPRMPPLNRSAMIWLSTCATMATSERSRPCASSCWRYLAQRHLCQRRVVQHDVRTLLVEGGLDLLATGGAGGPDRDATVAQQADDLFGILDRGFNEQDLDHRVFFHRHIGSSVPRHTSAGLYLEVSPGWVFAGGGLYMPDPASLVKIRERIAASPTSFRAIVESPALTRIGGLQGDAPIRVPGAFRPDHPAATYLRQKQFLAFREWPPTLATSPTFWRELPRSSAPLHPLVADLNRAMDVGGDQSTRTMRRPACSVAVRSARGTAATFVGRERWRASGAIPVLGSRLWRLPYRCRRWADGRRRRLSCGDAGLGGALHASGGQYDCRPA